MRLRFFLLVTSFVAATSVASARAPAKLPEAAIRKEMILKAVSEMTRLDGEGLIPRRNRQRSWEETARLLAEEAERSNDLFALGRVFRRLDASYPNLHANVRLTASLDERQSNGNVVLPFTFSPFSVGRNSKAVRFVISSVSTALAQNELRLRKGDELIRINGIGIETWSNENFLFCKFPLREQCDLEFYESFRRELLSWNRHVPLQLAINRDGKEFLVAIPTETKTRIRELAMRSPACGVSATRYPGFTLRYEGFNLCAFESTANPSTILLRIRSFAYDDPLRFKNLPEEVEHFWRTYWKRESSRTENLIIDIVGNHGGESPIPYFALFFNSPYQELYVQFKKVAEFERADILDGLFWGDQGKKIWFENIKRDGTFAAMREGDFLKPIPQFCASETEDCRDGLFAPKKHSFNGSVKILVDHWCVSSCVGFISNMVSVLGNRASTYGLPDSGDSAYGRLMLSLSSNANGVETQVTALGERLNPSLGFNKS